MLNMIGDAALLNVDEDISLPKAANELPELGTSRRMFFATNENF